MLVEWTNVGQFEGLTKPHFQWPAKLVSPSLLVELLGLTRTQEIREQGVCIGCFISGLVTNSFPSPSLSILYKSN